MVTLVNRERLQPVRGANAPQASEQRQRLAATSVGRVSAASRVVVLTLALIAPLAPFAPLAPVAPVYAQPPTPELTKPVNDFAGVIAQDAETEIERRILALKQASGDVVVVAAIDTFAPYADIREYAVKMFQNNGRGIGAKGKDNGLLVLLAVNDRRVWVEVGYDLEQFITDGYAGELSRTVMTPYFRQGDYGRGLLEGVTQLVGRIAQSRGVTLNDVPVATGPPAADTIQVSRWVILAIIILFILMNNGRGRRSRMTRRSQWGAGPWSGWNSGVGPFGGGGSFGGGGFGGGFGGFGGGRSGGGGGGAGW